MSDSKNVVAQVTDYLNVFSKDKYDRFICEMNLEHRTLQQDFTVLCLKWLKNCASDEYRYDLRNEASHTVSKELFESFIEKTGFSPSESLPCI